MHKKISRRDALKVGAMGVLGGLAACTPLANATETLPTNTNFPATVPAAASLTPEAASTAVTDVSTLISDLTGHVTRYLDLLDEKQRAKTVYAFNDAELTRWHWTTPGAFRRYGLSIREVDMNTEQHDAAMAILQASSSAGGLQKALDIMSLQNDLGNDPNLYYVTVFGTPGVEPWGWRWEGHHLSRRFNIVNGRISVTPFFLGAWPTVNNAGLKAMEREEWAARELVTSIGDAAIFDQRTLTQHVTWNEAYVKPLETVGVPTSSMNNDQQALVMEIIHKYLDTLPDMIAASHLDRLEAAGFENIYFGWAGPTDAQEPYYYRLQGPTFLMEHDNSRNRGTHIHSVWRDFAEDFGQSL